MLSDRESFRLHLQQRDKEQQQLLQEKATLTQQPDDATTLLQQAEKDKSSLELGTIVLYCCLCVHCLHYNTSGLHNLEYGNSILYSI